MLPWLERSMLALPVGIQKRVRTPPPAQTGEIYEKLAVTHKTHCNNRSKIHFLFRLQKLGKGRDWVGMTISKIIVFANTDELG